MSVDSLPCASRQRTSDRRQQQTATYALYLAPLPSYLPACFGVTRPPANTSGLLCFEEFFCSGTSVRRKIPHPTAAGRSLVLRVAVYLIAIGHPDFTPRPRVSPVRSAELPE